MIPALLEGSGEVKGGGAPYGEEPSGHAALHPEGRGVCAAVLTVRPLKSPATMPYSSTSSRPVDITSVCAGSEGSGAAGAVEAVDSVAEAVEASCAVARASEGYRERGLQRECSACATDACAEMPPRNTRPPTAAAYKSAAAS